MNPMDLKRGIDLAVSAIVEDLKKALEDAYGSRRSDSTISDMVRP
jgi:chaperonin GroEL (HSP60 family)